MSNKNEKSSRTLVIYVSRSFDWSKTLTMMQEDIKKGCNINEIVYLALCAYYKVAPKIEKKVKRQSDVTRLIG